MQFHQVFTFMGKIIIPATKSTVFFKLNTPSLDQVCLKFKLNGLETKSLTLKLFDMRLFSL